MTCSNRELALSSLLIFINKHVDLCKPTCRTHTSNNAQSLLQGPLWLLPQSNWKTISGLLLKINFHNKKWWCMIHKVHQLSKVSLNGLEQLLLLLRLNKQLEHLCFHAWICLWLWTVEACQCQLSGPCITSSLLNQLVVNKTVIQGICTTEWWNF